MTSPTDTDRTFAMVDLIRAVLKMSAYAHRAGLALNRKAGLTNARWMIIDQAAVNDAPITVSEHARRVGLSRQAVQRLVDDMVGDGWVVLKPDPGDRRARFVELTEKGRAAQVAALERAIVYNASLAEGFDERALRDAVSLVSRITARMMDHVEIANRIGGHDRE